MFHACKVTVIKRTKDQELCDRYLENPDRMCVCDIVTDNQEFVIDNPWLMPEGICASAWADIRPHIITMATGGKFTFLKNQNVAIATCTDPFRPVIFQIERI